MSIFSITLVYLRTKWLNTMLHIIVMALGMMLMTALLLFGHQLEQRLYRDSAGVDVVIGAKGSPLQLILSSVQHVDIPTGNISLDDAKKIQSHPHIKQAIPLSLGDSYRGHRIVGTEPAYIKHFNAELAEGQLWQNSMQAVLGFDVAEQLGLGVGDTFSGNHGLLEGGHAHEGQPYQVVGVLQETGTVLDRLIVTSLESVWDLHSEESHQPHEEETHSDHDDHDEEEHHDHAAHHPEENDVEEHREITALIASYSNRSAVMSFPRFVNQKTAMQAASPAFELARLIELVGFGSDSLFLLGVLLIGVSLASVFVALLNSIRERRYDLAVLRTLGASHNKLFRLVLIEGLLIACIGSLVGLLAGHITIELIGYFTAKGQEMGLTGFVFLPSLMWLWLGVIIVSALACLIPAWQASKVSLHSLLREAG